MSSVTALLPAWQAEGFIQRTLDSLSLQTYPNFRVLVSVDVCTDSTAEICERHAARDQRFSVLRQTERKGYVGNCNALLAMADSDYVLFAFHDDVIKPEYVSRLAAVLDARPEVVLSFSDVLLTHVNGRRERWQLTEMEGLQDRIKRAAHMFAPKVKWWVPNRGLFRLARARRIGGLKLHGAGEFSTDKPWLFHMALLGQFARVPEILCLKYYQPGSLSRSWAYSQREHFEVISACLRELWDSELSTEEKLSLATPLMKLMLVLRARLSKSDGI